MTKARFAEEQPPVTIKEQGELYYIHICLNGEWKEEEIPDIFEGDSKTERYWGCDYNEIVTDDIDVEDVEAHPERYLDFVVKKVDPIEQLRADVDYLLALSE